MTARFHEEVMGVYFDDLDPFHILHNAKYLLLFERTIGAFWMRIGMGELQDPDRSDRFHFVRTNHVDYLNPVRGVGRVRVRVWVEHVGRTSLRFAFKMMPMASDRQPSMDEDRCYARGTRTVVRIDPTSQRPEPWSDEFRALIAPWVGAEIV